jgi:hypothetical protein
MKRCMHRIFNMKVCCLMWGDFSSEIYEFPFCHVLMLHVEATILYLNHHSLWQFGLHMFCSY